MMTQSILTTWEQDLNIPVYSTCIGAMRFAALRNGISSTEFMAIRHSIESNLLKAQPNWEYSIEEHSWLRDGGVWKHCFVTLFPFPEPLSLEKRRQRPCEEMANCTTASSIRSTPMTQTRMSEERRASRVHYAKEYQLQARNQDVRMAFTRICEENNMSKPPTKTTSESESASPHIIPFDTITSQQYFRGQTLYSPSCGKLPQYSTPALPAKHSLVRVTFEKAKTNTEPKITTSPTASPSACHSLEISASPEDVCQTTNPAEIAVKNYGLELSTSPFIFTSAPYEAPKSLPYPQNLPRSKREPKKNLQSVQAEDSILNFDNSSRIKEIKKPQTKKVAATSKLSKHASIIQPPISPCARIKSPTKFESPSFNSMSTSNVNYSTNISKSTNNSDSLSGNNSPADRDSPKLPSLPRNEVESSPLKLSTPASASPVRKWIITTPDHLLPAEFRMMINPVLAPAFQEHDNNYIPQAIVPCWDALPRFPAVQNDIFQAVGHDPGSRGEAYPWLMSPSEL